LSFSESINEDIWLMIQFFVNKNNSAKPA